MTFLNPAALWTLLTIIPLIILYLLKVRPSRKETSTLFLWEHIFEEKKQHGFLKNLRELFSLLIMLISFCLIIFSMARPTFNSQDQKSDLVIIIDNSASMSTKEAGDSRLAQAKVLCKNIINNLVPSQQVVISSLNKSLTVVTNATNNQRELLKGLGSIKQSQFSYQNSPLKSLTKNREILPTSRFILISDGCAVNLKSLKEIELIKVGSDAQNIGIVSFDLNSYHNQTSRSSLFFQLASSLPTIKEVDVILSYGEKSNVIKVIPVKVKPGINKPLILDFENESFGEWFLEIDATDDLEIDDTAYAYLNRPNPVKVALHTSQGQSFYHLCVQAFSKSGELKIVSNSSQEVVLCYENPDNSNSPKVIFSPKGKSPFWQTVGSELKSIIPKTLNAPHPLVNFVDWETMNFAGAKHIKPPSNSIIFVENEDGVALMYKTTVDGISAIVVNMNPAEAQLYYDINFPIMIFSMVKELAPHDASQSFNLKTGDPISLKNKTLLPHFRTKLRDFIFTPQTAGFYKLKTNNGKIETYAVSLLSQQETLVNNSSINATAKPIQSEFPLTDLFLAIALILIAVECILYHQRKVG